MREYYIITAFIAVNLWAICLTVYDKRAAKKGARRVRERTLLLVSLLGGSIAMLVTMRFVRHKTKHAKFMVGIPVIILLQIAATILFFWWKNNGGDIS